MHALFNETQVPVFCSLCGWLKCELDASFRSETPGLLTLFNGTSTKYASQAFLCKSSIIFNQVSVGASRDLLVSALQVVRAHEIVRAAVHLTVEEIQVLPSPCFTFTSEVQGSRYIYSTFELRE